MFGIVAIISAVLMGIRTYILDSVESNIDVGSKIIQYIENSRLEPKIGNYYKLTNYDRFRFGVTSSSTDTSGLSKFSKLLIDSTFREIESRVPDFESEVRRENALAGLAVAGVSAVITCFFYLISVSLFLAFWRSRIIKYNLIINDLGATAIKENLDSDDGERFFTQLVEINFKYLDQYYLQTQEQANKSFWITAISSIMGFLLIIVGVILMYNGVSSAPGYVATSAGVISEFIASVFFYLYNRTILKMSEYHQKLVLTQNISLALKTADSLTETKEKTLETIIDRLTCDINNHLTASGG